MVSQDSGGERDANADSPNIRNFVQAVAIRFDILSTWHADVRVVITIRNFVGYVGQLRTFEERQNDASDSGIPPIQESLESNLFVSVHDNFYHDYLLQRRSIKFYLLFFKFSHLHHFFIFDLIVSLKNFRHLRPPILSRRLYFLNR